MPSPPESHPGLLAGFEALIEPFPLGRLRAQDHLAFSALIDRQYRPVHRYLARLVGDGEGAADLTQETFLRAYLALPRLADGSNVVAWLFRIATNLARQHHRRRQLIDWSRLSGRETHQLSGRSLEDDITRRDLIGSALAQLPLDQRSCLLLYAWTGYSCAEIGEIVGKSTPAVRMLLMRARRRFRTVYGDGDDVGLPGGAVPTDGAWRPQGASGGVAAGAPSAPDSPLATAHQHGDTPADGHRGSHADGDVDGDVDGRAGCRVLDEVMLFYPRGDLSPAGFATVTRHLATCSHCRTTLAGVQATNRVLQRHLERAAGGDAAAARAIPGTAVGAEVAIGRLACRPDAPPAPLRAGAPATAAATPAR